MGIVTGLFCKEAFCAQCPVYLVSRNMIEAMLIISPLPGATGSVEQVHGADYVGHYKSRGVTDGPVYMRFSGQVNNSIRFFRFKKFADELSVDDIAFDKTVIRPILNILQVFEVAGIGELIQIDDLIIRVGVHHPTNHMGAYETRSTCHNNFLHDFYSVSKGFSFFKYTSQAQAERIISSMSNSAFHPSSSVDLVTSPQTFSTSPLLREPI